MIVCEYNNTLTYSDSAGFEELANNAGDLKFTQK
jgi:hypothetical protein